MCKILLKLSHPSLFVQMYTPQPEQPLPKLNGNPGHLPSELHAHLAHLLAQKPKRRREGDGPRLHRSQAEATLWCLQGAVADIKIPSELKTGKRSPWDGECPRSPLWQQSVSRAECAWEHTPFGGGPAVVDKHLCEFPTHNRDIAHS